MVGRKRRTRKWSQGRVGLGQEKEREKKLGCREVTMAPRR